MAMLYGLPKFLCGKGSDARDRCLETTRRYLERGWRNIDWSATEKDDPSWEPNFGSKLMGLIWAINSNAILMTSWIIIEVLRRPEDMTVDIPSLKKIPLLNSVYLECLRLRSLVFVVRKLRNSIDVDGYTLKAGNLIFAPSYLAHKDPSVWSTTPQHPPEEFCAERFMKPPPSGASIESSATSSTLNAGKCFPYGGGSAMCPGRNYAKQEILAAVALFFNSFEVEVLHFVDRHGKYSSRGPEVGAEMRGGG
ncbi:cytochrome P450 [Apodospora peruviana]|uniref:Cytochrome P450 n=1 Tax=Apodospora peruviana TaxID=516989 RepID=A0AAE0LYV9_9PEZI|nr:cytochrome P450 [Apodospora peruviana]